VAAGSLVPVVHNQEDSLGRLREEGTDSQVPQGSREEEEETRVDTPAGQEVGRNQEGSQDAAEGRAVG
jgi:hypothetical protein